MATIVSKTIGSGGDYSTLQAWEDACPANLVTADQIWQGKVKNQVFSSTGTLLTISGTTVDATRYVELTTDTGASFLDHANVRTNALRYNEANGACIKITGAWSNAVVIDQIYTRVSKLQFSSTSAGGGAKAPFSIGNGSGAANSDINQCIFETYSPSSASTGAGGVSISGAAIRLRNSLVVQRTTNSSAFIAQLSGGASAHNCTLVSIGTTLSNGLYAIYGTGTLSNCYIGGVSAPKTGSAGLTVTTCHTDATASGYTTTAFSTSTFENITDGTHDLRLKSGSALIDVGTTDSTYAASDISGLARSGTYDVGAWEAASADTTAPTLTSASVTAVGTTTSTGNVTTNEANGTLYSIVSTSATAPSATQIQAGQNHTGAAAVWSGNQAVSSTGAKTFNITGLTASTAYYAHFQHKDAANNNSTVVTSAQFTTGSADTTVPTLTGSITISSKTTTSYTATWPSGSDNVAVTGYEYRLNAGSWVSVGNVLTIGISARTPGSTDTFEVRAYDAAGNKSTPALSTSVTLADIAVGTITFPAVKDWSTGNLKLNESGVTVIVNNVTTGALVIKLTGKTTHATTGVCTVSDALIIAGTQYRATLILADGSEGTWKYSAT